LIPWNLKGCGWILISLFFVLVLWRSRTFLWSCEPESSPWNPVCEQRGLRTHGYTHASKSMRLGTLTPE
jgi:hypothetical protein